MTKTLTGETAALALLREAVDAWPQMGRPSQPLGFFHEKALDVLAGVAGIDNDPTATAPFPAIFSNDEITLLQTALRASIGVLCNSKEEGFLQRAMAARLEAFRRPMPDPVTLAAAAVLHLKAARDCLKAAGAGEGRAIDRIRHAMKSAEGAVRHAEGKAVRS